MLKIKIQWYKVKRKEEKYSQWKIRRKNSLEPNFGQLWYINTEMWLVILSCVLYEICKVCFNRELAWTQVDLGQHCLVRVSSQMALWEWKAENVCRMQKTELNTLARWGKWGERRQKWKRKLKFKAKEYGDTLDWDGHYRKRKMEGSVREEK